MTGLVCIPTHSERESCGPHPHQHLVPSVFRISAILLGVQRYLIVLFSRISLMTFDVEHLFTCQLAPRMSSLVKYLLESLAHFNIGPFFSWSLSCKSSVCILDASLLSDVFCASVSSQSVARLLVLLILSLAEQFLMLRKSSLEIQLCCYFI